VQPIILFGVAAPREFVYKNEFVSASYNLKIAAPA